MIAGRISNGIEPLTPLARRSADSRAGVPVKGPWPTPSAAASADTTPPAPAEIGSGEETPPRPAAQISMFWPSRPRLLINRVGLRRCPTETSTAPSLARGRWRAAGLDRSLRSRDGWGFRTSMSNAKARDLDRHARGRDSWQLLLPRHVHQPGSAHMQAARVSWSLRRWSRRTAVREKRFQKRVAHNRDGHAIAWGIRRVLAPHLRCWQLSAGRLQPGASGRPARLSARQRRLEGRLFSRPCLRPSPAVLPHCGPRPAQLAQRRARRLIKGMTSRGMGFSVPSAGSAGGSSDMAGEGERCSPPIHRPPTTELPLATSGIGHAQHPPSVFRDAARRNSPGAGERLTRS